MIITNFLSKFFSTFLLHTFSEHTNQNIIIHSNFAEKPTLLQYSASYHDLPQDKAHYLAQTDGSDYVRYGFKIRLERRLFPFILAYYLPSSLLVLISFISFYIDPDVVPGRMALLITLVLMLINLSNSCRAESPRVNSFFFIFVFVRKNTLLDNLRHRSLVVTLPYVLVYACRE